MFSNILRPFATATDTRDGNKRHGGANTDSVPAVIRNEAPRPSTLLSHGNLVERVSNGEVVRKQDEEYVDNFLIR